MVCSRSGIKLSPQPRGLWLVLRDQEGLLPRPEPVTPLPRTRPHRAAWGRGKNGESIREISVGDITWDSVSLSQDQQGGPDALTTASLLREVIQIPTGVSPLWFSPHRGGRESDIAGDTGDRSGTWGRRQGSVLCVCEVSAAPP